MSGRRDTVLDMDGNHILDHLDDDQRAVAETVDRPLCVIAGAGTGKTRTLTYRLAYAAMRGEIDASATMALTFTTVAAAELRTRLEKLDVHGVATRTFHSACFKQAQYFWPKLYNCRLPPVQDRRESLIKTACQRLGIKPTGPVVREIDAEISWTKQTNVLPEQYVELAYSNARRLGHISLDMAAEAIVAYEDAKQAACVIDLDDLLLCSVALGNTAAIHQLRARYRHFVFDEFQDLSPVQYRLVELWVGERDDVFVVGDPQQCIHSFAGASSRFLTGFAGSHQARSLQLRRNYRSTPQILQAANLVSGGVNALLATRDDGASVEWCPAKDGLEESMEIACWLKDRHRDGLDWEQMAILFRTRVQAQAIRQILADEQIPFNYQSEPGDMTSATGVRLTTLHASKGMEWEAVGLPGLHDGAMPHPLANSVDQIGEERRLLFVGMTRARSFLRLSWPTMVDQHLVKASRFLDRLVQGLDPP